MPGTGKVDLSMPPTVDAHPYGIAIKARASPILRVCDEKWRKIDPVTMDDHGKRTSGWSGPRRMPSMRMTRYFTDFS